MRRSSPGRCGWRSARSAAGATGASTASAVRSRHRGSDQGREKRARAITRARRAASPLSSARRWSPRPIHAPARAHARRSVRRGRSRDRRRRTGRRPCLRPARFSGGGPRRSGSAYPGRSGGPHSFCTEVLCQCAVVELTDDPGVDVLGVEPLLQRTTHGRRRAWKEKRGSIQGARKLAASRGGEPCGGKESRAALAEKMAERPDRDAGPGGSIGDDDIHPVERQLGDELLNRLVCAADDLNGVAQPEGGLQKPPHQRRGGGRRRRRRSAASAFRSHVP